MTDEQALELAAQALAHSISAADFHRDTHLARDLRRARIAIIQMWHAEQKRAAAHAAWLENPDGPQAG